MKTVRKNQIDKLVPKITDIRAYTLDNGFTGQPVEDTDYAVNISRKLDAKFVLDAEAGVGKIRIHSNWWYEFRVAA